MEIREINVKANMDGFGIPNPISGVLFGGEDQAHKFIVAEQSGEAFAGTVSAKFLRYADDQTVPLTGIIEDGKASVTLIENCYYLPGRFKLTIYITANGSTTAVYCCMGTVDRTDGRTTVDPSGEINLDVTDLINRINAATATIPPEYTALLNTIAPTFSTSTAYAAGQYVWNGGTLYRFTADHAAGAWIGTDATAAVIGEDVNELKSAIGNDLTFDCTDGSYIDPNGNVVDAANSCATDYISVTPGEKIHFKNLKLDGTRSICAYNSDKIKMQTIATGTSDTERTIIVPDGAAYIRATGANGTNVTATVLDIFAMVKNNSMAIGEIDTTTKQLINTVGNNSPTVTKTDGKYIDPNGNVSDAANSCATDYIPVVPGQAIYLSALKLTGTRSVCGYTINKAFSKRIVGGSSDTTLSYVVDDGIYYIRATGESGTAPNIKYLDLIGALIATSTNIVTDYAFVATTGNDETGDGMPANPYASINRALKSGAENIYIASGIYDETINLANTTKAHLRFINASRDSKVVFMRSDSVIATSASVVSGYSRVYSAVTSKTYNTSNTWIYQDGVSDASTEITAAERHPAQKGRAYRNPDTKIIKCTATSLNDALAEIENSDTYKWFVNSGMIYFSCPQTVSASYPICADFGFTLFTNAQQYHSVEISGIDTKYMRINLNDMKNARAVDCTARNVFGAGAFTYNSRNTTLIRCEAANCVNGANGDGFNGAATITGDADAAQTTTELIDCWSHDNNDDGYSDHNRSDAVMRGGLYEYNVKAGVTPSSGENFAAYGVLSRKNVRGFFLTSAISDGSKATSAILYNCVADNNTGRADSSGFTVNADAGSAMTLVECIAMNSPAGYRSETGSTLTLIDCKTIGTTTDKAGAGTINVINPNAINV